MIKVVYLKIPKQDINWIGESTSNYHQLEYFSTSPLLYKMVFINDNFTANFIKTVGEDSYYKPAVQIKHRHFYYGLPKLLVIISTSLINPNTWPSLADAATHANPGHRSELTYPNLHA